MIPVKSLNIKPFPPLHDNSVVCIIHGDRWKPSSHVNMSGRKITVKWNWRKDSDQTLEVKVESQMSSKRYSIYILQKVHMFYRPNSASYLHQQFKGDPDLELASTSASIHSLPTRWDLPGWSNKTSQDGHCTSWCRNSLIGAAIEDRQTKIHRNLSTRTPTKVDHRLLWSTIR